MEVGNGLGGRRRRLKDGLGLRDECRGRRDDCDGRRSGVSVMV